MAAMKSTSALSKKLNAFVALSTDESRVVGELESRCQRIPKGQDIIQEGQTGQTAFIVQEGWASTFKVMPDGARQIIGFPIPGDCVGLRSVLLWTSDYSFSTITDSVVCPVSTARMLSLFNDFPRLGAAFLWAASRDEAMVVEHLVNIGRRSALERTAHFFMELAERLMLVGLATTTEFICPLNQYVIADALGLTAIHVNRVLRELRETNFLTLKSGTVTIHDLAALRKLAGYRSVNGARKTPE